MASCGVKDFSMQDIAKPGTRFLLTYIEQYIFVFESLGNKCKSRVLRF